MDVRLSNDKENLILDNQKLIHYTLRRMNISQKHFEYEDLVSVGTIGLIKAANTFDETKKHKFSTYAVFCIKNEIIMYFRKQNYDVYSLNQIIQGTDDLTLEDVVEDPKACFVDSVVEEDTFVYYINIILNSLYGKERVVFLYHIGNLKQYEIAKKIGYSKTYITYILKKVKRKMSKIIYKSNRLDEKHFSFCIKDNLYMLSFSNKIEDFFNKGLDNFIEKIKREITVSKIEIIRNNNNITLKMPQNIKSFRFLASFFQEIEEYNI